MPYSLLVAFVDLRYWDVHKVSLHPFSFPTKKKIHNRVSQVSEEKRERRVKEGRR